MILLKAVTTTMLQQQQRQLSKQQALPSIVPHSIVPSTNLQQRGGTFSKESQMIDFAAIRHLGKRSLKLILRIQWVL